MAAFSSYQQPAFLPDTTFWPTEFIPDYNDLLYSSSFGMYQNNQEGSSIESSCLEQQSIHNETYMADKALSSEQVTQNWVLADKKGKSKTGSSFNSANSKDVKQMKLKEKTEEKDKKKKDNANEEPPKAYVYVRAKRGQATDSHSLAERVRREKISAKMRTLQALVPGCDKVIGKALVLDEIINYVQSLQNQNEFLLGELASLDPTIYTFGLMDLDPMIFGAEVQDGESSYWGVNEQEQQSFINQFGLSGNNLYSLQ